MLIIDLKPNLLIELGLTLCTIPGFHIHLSSLCLTDFSLFHSFNIFFEDFFSIMIFSGTPCTVHSFMEHPAPYIVLWIFVSFWSRCNRRKSCKSSFCEFYLAKISSVYSPTPELIILNLRTAKYTSHAFLQSDGAFELCHQ